MKKHLLMLLICYTGFSFGQPCVVNSNSMQFNGNTTTINFTSSANLSISDSITIEAWINASGFAATPAQGTIFCFHSWTGVGGEQGYVLRAGGTGTVSWNFAGLDTSGNPTSWNDLMSPANAITLNTWYHVAATYDGNSSKLYINGALVAAATYPGSIVPSSAYMPKIGSLSDGGVGAQRFWNGKLDEIRIWHRVLNATEINANKNRHIDPATATGLAGYWRLNDGTGTTADDLSASSNNGTVVSGTWSTNVPFVEQPPVPVVQNFPQLLNCLSTGVTYQWNLAGSPISGATQQFYTPTQTGSYTVTVTSSSGCTATSLPATWTVGIDEHDNSGKVNLGPVPASERIMLQIEQRSIYDQYTIYNASGQQLRSAIITIEKFSVPVADLSPGVYYIMLSGKENTVRKFTVQH